ncbi:CLUMA_CG019188, isoform A [Clunio marinus]|uniref:CLUMA_CG019188, isoform A n=1 Tax=Clunio marinus TaxID=568069 RepID=A0A1J1J1R1_9DIPT|nr:CLUMA_CG019188, isoform A [Clunio marinus]
MRTLPCRFWLLATNHQLVLFSSLASCNYAIKKVQKQRKEKKSFGKMNDYSILKYVLQHSNIVSLIKEMRKQHVLTSDMHLCDLIKISSININDKNNNKNKPTANRSRWNSVDEFVVHTKKTLRNKYLHTRLHFSNVNPLLLVCALLIFIDHLAKFNELTQIFTLNKASNTNFTLKNRDKKSLLPQNNLMACFII